MMMNTNLSQGVGEVAEADFDAVLSAAAVPVLVDFYAPWCGPCKMATPMLEALAIEYTGRVQFLKGNVDEAGSLASRFEITGVPTFDGHAREHYPGFVCGRTLEPTAHGQT